MSQIVIYISLSLGGWFHMEVIHKRPKGTGQFIIYIYGWLLSNKTIVSFEISLPIPTETKSVYYYFPFCFGYATKTQKVCLDLAFNY
ncbi:hypothetical protein Hanom_Chr05g00434141 [Helianthus anomalus]